MWGWFSALKSFDKVDPPAPVSPSGIITNANPTFRWVMIPGATQYYLVLQTSTGAAVKSLEIKSPTCFGTICSYTPSPTFGLLKGNYKWKIRAYNGYYGPYSAYMAFTRN